MDKAPQKRFNSLYQKQTNASIRQGKANSTIDAYYRATRRSSGLYYSGPRNRDSELK